MSTELWTARSSASESSSATSDATDTTMNTYFRRSESNWLGDADAKEVSVNYWRKQARYYFQKFPSVEVVEIVRTGRKTDSKILKRGSNSVPRECAVILASTGGSWGRSRRDFLPVRKFEVGTDSRSYYTLALSIEDAYREERAKITDEQVKDGARLIVWDHLTGNVMRMTANGGAR